MQGNVKAWTTSLLKDGAVLHVDQDKDLSSLSSRSVKNI